jgi:hypothetical protein
MKPTAGRKPGAQQVTSGKPRRSRGDGGAPRRGAQWEREHPMPPAGAQLRSELSFPSLAPLARATTPVLALSFGKINTKSKTKPPDERTSVA